MSCTCTGPESCGIAGVVAGPLTKPCHLCRKDAVLVTNCGMVRCRHVHPMRATPMLTRPEAAAVAAMDGPAGQDTGDKPLRLLAALEGAYLPTRKVGNLMKPATLCPPLPGMVNLVRPAHGYGWQRKHKGPVVQLDRNAAYLSAASSAVVAHGVLEHTGPLNAYNPTRAGYYLVMVMPWQHARMLPNPLGDPRTSEIWVPGPTLQLLSQLAATGMWGDVEILDSYTAAGCRLTAWTTMIRDLRSAIITKHGRGSQQYDQLKQAYSQALTLMVGVDEPGSGRRWKCKAHRPDWSHTIYAQASATLFRAAWRCTQLAPTAGPVALVNTDELHLPEQALPQVSDAGGDKSAPIRLDPAGIRLGTFKVKEPR